MAWLFPEKNTTEEAATIKNSRLAALIEHSFNALFLALCAQYIFTVSALIMYCDTKWMSLGFIAFLTPYFGLMLHVTPPLKAFYVEKYVVAPLDAKAALAGLVPLHARAALAGKSPAGKM